MLPFRTLAAHVMRQAMVDLRGRGTTAPVRASARMFLNSDWLSFWCALAGADPSALRDRLARRDGRAR